MTVIGHIVDIWKHKEHLLVCFGIIFKNNFKTRVWSDNYY